MRKFLLPLFMACLIISTQAIFNTENWKMQNLDLKLDKDGELFMFKTQSGDYGFSILEYGKTVFAYTAKDATDQEYDHVNGFQTTNADGEDLGSFLLDDGYTFLGVQLTHTNNRDEFLFARIKRVEQQDQLEIGFGKSNGETRDIQTLFPDVEFSSLTQPQVSKGSDFIYIVTSYAKGEENGFTITMIKLLSGNKFEIYRNELIQGQFQWNTQLLQAYDDDTALIIVNTVQGSQITYTLYPDSSMEGPNDYDGEFYLEKPFFYYRDVLKSQKHYYSELSTTLYRTAQGKLFAATYEKDGTQVCNKQISIAEDPNYNYIDFGYINAEYLWVLQYNSASTSSLFLINPSTCKLRGNNSDKYKLVNMQFPRAYTVFQGDGDTFIGVYGQMYDGDKNDYNQNIVNKMIYIGTNDLVEVKNCAVLAPFGCVECDEGYVKDGHYECVEFKDQEGSDGEDGQNEDNDNDDEDNEGGSTSGASLITISMGVLVAVLAFSL